MKKFILFIGIALVLFVGCRLIKRPSPEEIIKRETITGLTQVKFPPLREVECLSVEGGNAWKCYDWIYAEYGDPTLLDSFFVNIDSAIASGDLRWHRNDSLDYTFSIDEYVDIHVGRKGIFIDMERYLWE